MRYQIGDLVTKRTGVDFGVIVGVDKANANLQNAFSNDKKLASVVDRRITQLHWAISKTNEVLHNLVGQSFDQRNDLSDYLDQDFLNRTHRDWVASQRLTVDIDRLRFSSNPIQARLGNQLHGMYPDEIRFPKLANVLEKIGYIFPYEEVNMAVHRLESSFNNRVLEFSADAKWQVFDNPYQDKLVTNNDVVNFSFGYTYVGRQLYNKFRFFDTELKYEDHYNYEQLEFSFQINLMRPETIPFSQEAVGWANQHKHRLTAEQIPIGNLENLDQKLFDYRKLLYRNLCSNNRATISIRG